MYILAVNGSPNRDGNTVLLLQAVLDAAAEEGVEGRLIHVMDAVKGQKMPFCLACSSPCKEACHGKDAGLREACASLEAASAVVLGSPVYFGTVSAQLKALWDKTRAVRARRSLVGKPAAAVSVGAARFGGQETTVKAQENQQDYEVKLRELALKERQVEIEERKLAMEELTIINAKQDEAMQAALDARRAEYEAQAAAQ